MANENALTPAEQKELKELRSRAAKIAEKGTVKGIYRQLREGSMAIVYAKEKKDDTKQKELKAFLRKISDSI